MGRKLTALRVRRKFFQHVFWARGLLISVLLVVLVFGVWMSVSLGKRVVPALWQAEGFVYKFLAGPQILSQVSGRTNFLIMGAGDITHGRADLTDSILFVSYHQGTGRVTMISIPPNLWMGDLGATVSAAFRLGEQRQAGGGLVMAKSAVEEAVGQKVDYALVIDFDVFRKIVDSIGGITVCVDRSFDDFKYPVVGEENVEPVPDRYEHVHFDAGCQRMDGGTALKFVRSRYTEGREGASFAMSERQEKVILAIKDKVFSKANLVNIGMASRLIGIFDREVLTDIPKDDVPVLIRIGLRLGPETVALGRLDSDNLGAGIQKLLVGSRLDKRYGYQEVLLPKDGDGNWQTVHGYVNMLTSF